MSDRLVVRVLLVLVRAEVSVCSCAVLVLAVAASTCGASSWTSPIVPGAPTVAIPGRQRDGLSTRRCAQHRNAPAPASVALVDILDRSVIEREGGGA